MFAKVNRVRFSQQGNKFGACDADGNVALWQAANASQPFFVSVSRSPFIDTWYWKKNLRNILPWTAIQWSIELSEIRTLFALSLSHSSNRAQIVKFPLKLQSVFQTTVQIPRVPVNIRFEKAKGYSCQSDKWVVVCELKHRIFCWRANYFIVGSYHITPVQIICIFLCLDFVNCNNGHIILLSDVPMSFEADKWLCLSRQ